METKKYRKDKIIYSLNIEDLQNVADDVLSRKLNASELSILEDKIGDYIDWYDVIHNAIIQNIGNK